MKKIQNVLFDLDGTLIDSSDGVVASFNHALTRAGDPLPDPEAIKQFIGYSLEETFPHFSSAPIEQLKSFFREKSNDLVVGATVPLPGVDEVLRKLSETYRLAIATTKVRSNVEGILHKLNWDEIFDTFAAGDEVPRVKPDPAIFRLALDRLDGRAEESVVVGDTINDVLAAKALSIPVIAVASPFEKREKVIAAEPDYFVESIRGVVDILARIDNRKESLS